MSNAAPLYIKRTTVPKFQQRKHGARGNRSGGAKLKLVGNAIVGGPANSNKPRRRNARRNRGRGGRGAGAGRGSNNSGPSRPFPTGVRQRSSTSRTGTTIVEDEYIQDIAGSTGFAVTQFNVNPGQATTFPWIARTAVLWEKYQFHKLEFYVKPIVSGFATNGQAGKVILSFDYDVTDPAPGSKQQMEDTDPHADAMPYESVALRINPRIANNQWGSHLVRPGIPNPRTDLRMYDIGSLFVGTSGNTNTTTIGELRVRYVCELSVPVLENLIQAPANYTVSVYRDTAAFALTSAMASAAPLGTTVTNGLGATNVAGVITPPAGNYLVNYSTQIVAATNATIMTVSLVKNMVVVQTTNANFAAAAVCTTDILTNSFWLTMNGTDNLQISVNVTGTGALTELANMIITQV